MESPHIQIQPYSINTTRIVTNMTIKVIKIELFKGATLHVILMDAQNGIVDTKIVDITGEDYKQWGGDDNFVYQYISRKMNFNLQNPTVTPDTPVIPETPVIPDTPIITDTPVIPDTPVITDTPVIADTPVIPETPVITDTPTDTPTDTETPIV